MKPRGTLFGWLREAPRASRRSLLAASLGWMLDSFDVMLYAMVLAYLMKDLGMTKTTGGLMGSVTLVASAAGGVIFGVVADRLGRTKALRASILIYSVFTAACGLASSVPMLAVFRVFLGLGMGGEWASGAALVSETWPAEHRGKAFGVVQSFWAVGYAAAALVTAVIYPWLGWRAVFFVGVLPALLVFWIQARVEEPAIWREQKSRMAETNRPSIRSTIRGRLLGTTVLITLMNAATLFAWWGFNLWIPGYLSLARDQGGIGLSPRYMSALIVFMQVGMWLGYLTYGYISDVLGRKKTYMLFLLCAAALVIVYAGARAPVMLFFLGPFVAFFGTGYFSGFGALTAELYPTSIRATLQGFTYNIGRVVSAAAPLIIGSLAQSKGFGTAFLLVAGAFVLAAVLWIWIPETRGRQLA
ncbi:MAG: MFS transporter [Candidatus Aminicenantes bacterium]|nr:MFS transporter [Candidatus Aminicenantes bacterium]